MKAAAALLILLTQLTFAAETPAPAGPNTLPQTVTLLTSFDPKGTSDLFYLQGYYRSYLSKVEKLFRKHFEGSGLEIDVRHFVDRYEAREVLRSPKNVAVFWLSHGGAPKNANPAPGLEVEPILADVNNSNVMELLGDVHPNLRILGLAGCNSGVVYDFLKKKHPEMVHTDAKLEILGFEKKIAARKGLKKLLKLADPKLASLSGGYAGDCPKRLGYPATLTRVLRPREVKPETLYTFPPVSVQLAGRIVATFPGGKVYGGTTDVTQRREVFLEIPAGAAKASELNIEVDSGASLGQMIASKGEIGFLELSPPWADASWSVFANAAGIPLGVTSYLYKYKGSLPVTAAPIEFEPYECASLAPRGAGGAEPSAEDGE